MKAIHAALASKNGVQIFPDVPRGINEHRLIYDATGYDRHISKLALGTWQMMLVSRTPGFMPVMNRAALWRRLASDQFTTPIIRAWLPWIERELIARELLLPLRCFNCACAWLKATTNDLDEIVTTGLRTKELVIA